MAKRIRITFDESGKETVDFDGYQGKACLDDRAKLDAYSAEHGLRSHEESRRMKHTSTGTQVTT